MEGTYSGPQKQNWKHKGKSKNTTKQKNLKHNNIHFYWKKYEQAQDKEYG